MSTRVISASLVAFVLLTGLWTTLVADDAPKGAPPAKTLVGKIVESGEYYDTAKAIEAAANEDAGKLAPYFDLNALADIVLQGIELKPEDRKAFKEGFTSKGGGASLSVQIAAAAKSGGSYELLRVHRHGQDYAAIFRLNTGNGLNYHDLKFVKGADGKIKVNDMYVLLSGELMSTTVRQLVLPVIANQNRSLLSKLTQKESEYVTNFPKIQEITKGIQARDFAKVKATYDALPKSMKEFKTVLIMRYTAATQAQQWDEVRETTADFRRLFPNDGAIELLGIDALLLDKKFDEALASIDRIDKLVGGDPHLELLRENVKTLAQQ